ncbi:MAG: glycosyltransferase family 61 protein [Bacteroidetes bacterium]|nr:glycosyltransferase family 61 protein [Bacteroidota bacterium]
MKSKEELDRYLSFQRKKYFIKSFFRKAKRLIVDFLPLQSISEDFLVYRKELRPQLSGKVYTPKTFETKAKIMDVALNPVEVFGLKNVYVLPDSTSFLSTNLKTLYFEEVVPFSNDFTLMYHSKNLLFHSEKMAKVDNLPKVKINREALFLSGNFSFNYFHFLIEILSRLEFADKIPNFKDLLIVTSEKVEAVENMKTLLSFFLPHHKVQFLSENHYYQFPVLWHISYPNVVVPNVGEGEEYRAEFVKFSPQSVDFVRTTCLRNLDEKQVKIQAISKIFLARKSEFRKYNEPELLQVAERYGFQAVYLEDLNMHEQIFLMQNADFVLGPSGAAWTNVIFCSPGKAKGLLWLANVWKDFSVFSTLAELSDFDLYHWRFGDDALGFHDDYVLDPKEFELQLIQLLR